MSERGVFAVDRGIWSDPDFPAEPFSEREAFMWLVGQAAWKPCRVRVGSVSVDIERGQLAFSTRFMAAAWKWSEARVRRFLGRLVERETICSKTDARATHITVCNYDRFQRVSLPVDASATHERRKEEDTENTSLREGDSGKARKHIWPENFREETWRRYGKPVEKKAGIAALENLFKADRTSYTEFIAGVDRQAASVPDPQFRPSLERFIKREKWNDQQLPMEASRGPGNSDRVTPFPARHRPSRSAVDVVGAAMARFPDQGSFRSGEGEDYPRREDRRDYRSGRDDPEIPDADWIPARGHRAAH